MRGYFFNAQPTTDIERHPSGFDREYDALDFNRYMGVFFSNGVFVSGDPDACKVTAGGLRLSVRPGVALVNGGQCHFEAGDGVELTEGAGKYSVLCRMDSSAVVRGFSLVAVKGSDYPPPVRTGDVYDLCLAHVTATASSATVTDTRGDRAICGYASLTGQPPYYPPDAEGLPYPLWLYTMGFPLDAAQKAALEGNPSLMGIFDGTRLRPATDAEVVAGTDNAHMITPRAAKVAARAHGLTVAMGSYVGTGGYGQYSKNTLRFQRRPMLLLISGGGRLGVFLRGADGWNQYLSSPYTRDYTLPTEWGELTLNWYTTDTTESKYGNSAEGAQLNASGATYRYVAICEEA